MHLSQLPAIGQSLENGTFAGLTTTPDGAHCAVVLLPDTAERVSWQAAMDWASGIGATLPTRPVSALLFANLKPAFTPDWHWTSEPTDWDGSFAWGQHLNYGLQGYGHKSYEGRARAVRLIQITD